MPHFDLHNHPYQRRIILHRNLNLGHHHAGDFSDEEDPRKRGILRNTSCRRYREILRSSRQSQLLQGLAILAAVIVVLILMLFVGIKMSIEQMDNPTPREEGLWVGALKLLGLEHEDQLTGESYGQRKVSLQMYNLR